MRTFVGCACALALVAGLSACGSPQKPANDVAAEATATAAAQAAEITDSGATPSGAAETKPELKASPAAMAPAPAPKASVPAKTAQPKSTPKSAQAKTAAPEPSTSTCAPEHRALGHC